MKEYLNLEELYKLYGQKSLITAEEFLENRYEYNIFDLNNLKYISENNILGMDDLNIRLFDLK